MPDLEDLAAQAARGDRDAFAELASRLQGPVWRYAYHLTRRRDLADEAAQETWARAIRALRHFRGESTVQTWLLGRCSARPWTTRPGSQSWRSPAATSRAAETAGSGWMSSTGPTAASGSRRRPRPTSPRPSSRNGTGRTRGASRPVSCGQVWHW